jgi:ribosomal protein L34E
MVDLDAVEYCARCGRPLAFVETARDVGQTFKPAAVTQAVASAHRAPALCVLYRLDATGRITRFRVRELPSGPWRILSPHQYAAYLRRLRERHVCRDSKHPGGAT